MQMKLRTKKQHIDEQTNASRNQLIEKKEEEQQKQQKEGEISEEEKFSMIKTKKAEIIGQTKYKFTQLRLQQKR